MSVEHLFVKKRIPIRAVKAGDARALWEEDGPLLPKWLFDAINEFKITWISRTSICDHKGGARILTPEGEMQCSPDDWIVRGTEGELYSIKAEIMAKVHEEVSEEEAIGLC